MPRTLAVLAAIVIGSVIGALGAPAAAGAPAPSPAQAPADLAECFDGTCTVTIAGPVEIPLDERAGFTALSVLDVNRFAVTFALPRTGGTALGAVGTNGTARYGSGTGALTVHVVEIAGDTARLEITTSVP